MCLFDCFKMHRINMLGKVSKGSIRKNQVVYLKKATVSPPSSISSHPGITNTFTALTGCQALS